MRSEVPDPEVTSKMPLSMCRELTSESLHLEDRSHELKLVVPVCVFKHSRLMQMQRGEVNKYYS